MSKVALLFISCLCLCSVSFAQDTNFRNTKWGMSKEEVIQSEGREPSSNEDNVVIYNNEDVAGINLDVIYFFEENKLYVAKYFRAYDDIHMGNDNFWKLAAILKEKYGKGKIKVDKPRYVDSLESHLTNMSLTGRGGFSYEWKTKEQEVHLDYSGKGKNIFTLSIFYDSVKFKYLKENNKKNELKEKGKKL